MKKTLPPFLTALGSKLIPFKNLSALAVVLLLLFSGGANAQVTLTATAGTASGSFTTLKGAFDAINAGTHQGVIVISITANTTEGTTPATLNSTGAGSASYTSINIRPTSDGVSISGSPIQGFGVIQLKGADNVTIDGDNPNTGGTNRNLTITNTAVNTTTYTSVIRISTVNVAAALSADNITIKNCIITGSASSQNSSLITSTTGAGNSTFGILVGYRGGSSATDAPTAQASVTGDLVASTTVNNLMVDNNAINSCARGVAFIGNATTASSTGITIQNNLIGEQATTNSGAPPYTSPATTVYTKGIYVQGTNAYSITGNTIKNILSYVSTTINGIEVSSSGAGTGAAVVNSNSITGVVNNGSSSANGINLAGATWSSLNVNSNTITNIQAGTSGASVNGITIASAPLTGSLIEKNRISFVYARSTSGFAATGINQAGTNSLTIKNNMIWDLNAVGNNSTTGTTYGVRGIRLSAGTNHKVYHNTVSLSGALLAGATGVDVTAAFTITATTITGVDVRNNIFSNTMTGASAKHACVQIPTGATSAMNLLINNNAYYGSSTVNVGMTSGTLVEYPFANFVPSSTSGATNWRNYSSSLLGANTNNDNSSLGFTAAAPFVSSTNLHISTGATPTQLESGGVSAATTLVTTDIDGDARPGPSGSTNGGASAPDLGADEFDGAPSVPMSYTSSTTEQVTGSAYAGATNQSIIRVQIVTTGATTPLSLTSLTLNANGTTDIADINAATAKVYYTGSSTTFSTSSLFGSTTPTVANFTVTGSQTLGEGNNYFWLAYDVAAAATSANLIDGECIDLTVGTAQTPTVSAPSGNKSILGAMSGTYAVGASQTENGSAFTKLTTAIADLNLRGVSGAVIFALQSDYSSATETFPLTINAVTGASGTNTITIKPAATVTATISGSSSSSIFKLNGADYIIIDGSNNGSTSKDLTIINTNTGTSSAVVWLGSASVSNGATNNTIKNCIITGNAPTTTYGGIVSSSGSTIGDFAAIANANNTYNNNTVNTALFGIVVVGPTGNESGTVISGNLIGSATAGNKIGMSGIEIYQQTGVSVTGNTIFGVTTETSYTASGIYVSGTQSGGTISGNKISDIKNTNTTGYGSNGIGLYSSSTTGNVTLQNNMIYDVAAYGYTSVTEADNGYGIMINSGGGYNIYFNTVSLSVNQTIAGVSAAINIASSVTALNIRNNIFSNSQTTGTRYAIYTAGTAAGFTTINYNDYYSSGSVGFLSSARATLGNWQTASTQDASSIGVAPTFTSATDLHLTAVASASGNAALKAGTPISGITTDYDGEIRNTVTPAMGADEIFIDGFWSGATSTVWDASVTGNWDNGTIPASGVDIVVPAGVTNSPVLTSVSPTIGKLNLGTGKTLTLGSNTLTVNGEITGTGTLTGSATSSLVIGGTAGTLNFTNGSRTLKDLTLNSSTSATLGTALNITAGINSGTLIVGTGATLSSAGNLTLKSDANGTAKVGNSPGTVSGNVTVERYIPAKRAWRALTAPLKGSDTSIFSQWQNNGTVEAGIGVELWGPGGTGSSGNGLAVGPSNSILQYDNSTTGSWTPVTNTNNTLLFSTARNNAFMVFPTGGYGSGLISSSTTAVPTTLKATGQLITGEVTYSIPSSSHTLIGNPYACAISPLALLTANTTFDNNLWIWDPNVAGDLNVGAYNLFTKTGISTGTYTNTTGSSYTSNPTPDIQSGQAFFVKAATGTQTLTFTESLKTGTVSSNAIFREGNPAEILRLGLYKQENNEWSGRDGAITVLLPDANANQTPNKMANGSENIAFVKNGSLFASNHHLPLVASDVLNIRVWRTTAGANYKLKINTEQFASTNLNATLEDLFTNSRTPLNLEGAAVEYPFTVTTDALSTGDRFRIVFQNAVLGTNNPTATSFSIVPNPVTGDSFQVNLGTLATGTYSYSICNAIGQEVEKGSFQNATQNTNYTIKFRESAATGIYIMKIKGSDNTVITAKLIKK